MSGDAELDGLLGALSQPSTAANVSVTANKGIVRKPPPIATFTPVDSSNSARLTKSKVHDDDIDNIIAHMNFDPDAEDSHATCKICSSPVLVSQEYIEVGKFRYHPNCWTCTTCRTQLGGGDFFEDTPGARNCSNCHHKRLDSCPGCGNKIEGGTPIVNVEGRKYHDKCFVCATCRQPVTSYHERNGKIYCQAHYNEAFNPKCVVCAKPITSTYAQTGKGQFHVECFKCSRCSRNIGSDRYHESGGSVLCTNCAK